MDELATNLHHSCRISHRQVTTITSTDDHPPQDEVHAIRSSFYPPTGDLPSNQVSPSSSKPNQLSLNLPLPNINITQATPVYGENEFRFSRRQKHASYCSKIEDQGRGDEGQPQPRPLSYPQCHTHYISSPGGKVFMETHFP